MKKKHKEIPVPEPRPEDGFDCPSASWGDMTGLIPTPAENEHQRSSYGSILPYQAD